MEEYPDSKPIKDRHRENVKDYRKSISKKQDQFFQRLNKKLRSGKTISWNDFKKLKKLKNSNPSADSSLLNNFQQFYANLYSDKHPTISELTKSALLEEADTLANETTPNETLNSPFSGDELESAIASLKSGKASSLDHISNEMLKALNGDMRTLILKLFNMCLSTGTYFWSESVITPIHKKGCIQNPDNYRAIAVCSCIGKLLSTMLLSRLTSHRQSSDPDPVNQAGFTKGSQCNDHLFTLMSIMEKYKRIKSKVYAVFIDLRKAFDLVCRQALLFKLACYGVNGGFFNIIKSMYSSSQGFIKLDGKLSQAFRILKGTEQGHPLSPELFKVYFKELSDLLNAASVNCPSLAGTLVTHLAWADDLVVLTLDTESLQKQLIIIENYCNEWGLEINISKTKFMVMNGKLPPQPNWRPVIGGDPINIVSSYCYLGVIVSSNGKFTQAVNSLYRKGLGAYFSLRNTVDRRFIDPTCFDKLFNTLIRPILSYGCQVWCPSLPVVKSITAGFRRNLSLNQLLPTIAKSCQEQVHLRHLKYLLGTNRRSSNLAAWGETGKFPMVIEFIKLSVDYFKRVMGLPKTQLVKAAMEEQIRLQLPWYVSMKSVLESFNKIAPSQYEVNSSSFLNATLLSDLCSATTTASNIKELFTSSWQSAIKESRKLSFYSKVKSIHRWEPYLDHVGSFYVRRSTARIRCSSHKLSVETGRYANIPLNQRICKYCDIHKMNPVVEDENHVLHSCPLGMKERDRFYSQLRSSPNITLSPNFNLASTFQDNHCPPDSTNINLSSDDIKQMIKLSTRTINAIYTLTLKYKDSLKDSDN